MKKLLYSLILLVPLSMLLAASPPETKNYTFTYRVSIPRGDTTTGTTAAIDILSDLADSVKLLTIDVSRWDKLWVRVKTHEYFESGNVQFGGTTDSADLYGAILYMMINADAAVSPTTGKPIGAMATNPCDTAWFTYDFSKFYYNTSDTTKFIPEVQLFAIAWGDTFYFLNAVDSTFYDTLGVFIGDPEDTLAVLRYDFEITTIKK